MGFRASGLGFGVTLSKAKETPSLKGLGLFLGAEVNAIAAASAQAYQTSTGPG